MDTIIKGGLVVDGTGGAPRTGDIGIKAGRIVAPAEVDSRAQTIDAVGKVVAPGFIDIHTHFDPQLCWDGLATPSLEHGVTTVVIGNCSREQIANRPQKEYQTSPTPSHDGPTQPLNKFSKVVGVTDLIE